METESALAGAQPKARRNWWKVAFFVLLFVFEVTREWAVMASSESATPAVLQSVSSYGDFISAQGRWNRIDRGERLVPTIARIDCFRNEHRCIEVSLPLPDKSVGVPEIEYADATFAENAVTYETDFECVAYSVRLDLKLQKVFSVRQRKPGQKCARLEERIELQLGDGYDPGDDKLNEHFLPLVQLLRAI